MMNEFEQPAADASGGSLEDVVEPQLTKLTTTLVTPKTKNAIRRRISPRLTAMRAAFNRQPVGAHKCLGFGERGVLGHRSLCRYLCGIEDVRSGRRFPSRRTFDPSFDRTAARVRADERVRANTIFLRRGCRSSSIFHARSAISKRALKLARVPHRSDTRRTPRGVLDHSRRIVPEYR
jgi:hypothetical protein